MLGNHEALLQCRTNFRRPQSRDYLEWRMA